MTITQRGFTSLLLSGALLAAGAFMPAMAAEWTLIQAGTLIADPREDASGPATIIVKDDRIVRIAEGHVGAEAVTDRAAKDKLTVIDLSDQTVLPGLIDSHTHLVSPPGVPFWAATTLTEADDAVMGTANAAITVRAGFTTVRDLGSGPESMFAVRNAVSKGVIVGPRIIAAGPAVSIVGGHGDISGFRREVDHALAHLAAGVCTGAVECAEKVRSLSKYGADVIKITATGGVLSQQARGLDQHFSNEELRSIVETAHQLGLKVAAHAHGPRGIESAAAAGVDSVDHGTFADQAALRAMKKNGTYMVPTLMAFTGVKDRLGTGVFTPAVEEKGRIAVQKLGDALKAANEMGVPIAFGTDSGVFEHGRNAEEFQMMVEYGGLTPQEALISATTAAADLLGLSDEIGTLAAGKSADIVAVTGDPLKDAKVLQNVGFVMARGQVVLPAAQP